MKKVLATFVLALTTAALAQGTSPSQQPPAQQPGATDQSNVPTSQKTIKDPAEYNAYITALNTTDPAAKGAAMEAFVAQYPNSIVKIDALEQAMGAYQQAGNQQKVQQLASQILQLEPNNVRALAIVVFLERGQIKDPASGAKARADAERGLNELQNWKQPEGVSPADYEKMKSQMAGIFAGTAAFGALQQKDYPAAQKFYQQALAIDPNDLGNNYQMAISLLEMNPMNPLGFWYGAKALAVAQQSNPQAFQAWAPYFQSRYKKYHGSTDDWNQRIATAATQTAPPAGFVESIPLAPTQCDIAAQAVQQNGADNLSFSDWELVLSCRDKKPANKTAADQVWQAIQAKEKNGEAKLKIPVKVVAVPDPSTLEVAVSEDNQSANPPKTDMKVALEKPLAKPPAPGATIDVIGVISEYTPDPFMFTMTKAELPAAKPPARGPAKKKGAVGAKKKKKAA
jgi:tetratricopeptide (TPR) repeat protein